MGRDFFDTISLIAIVLANPNSGVVHQTFENQVPEKYLRFIRNSNEIYYEVYLRHIKYITEVAYPDEILRNYLRWEEVKQYADVEKLRWTKEDHDDFRELLHWCMNQKDIYAFVVNM